MSAQKDYLWLNLRDLPYFRALLRAVEARFYQDIDLPAPTLDLGCGDGHFASVVFDRPLEVGLEPSGRSIREAASRKGYRWLVQAEGGRIPFEAGSFASAISNSVLEHIPEVEAVLSEAARVLRPGAVFVFCAPNHRFLASLSIGRALDKSGLGAVGGMYRRFFNRISRHYHSDPPEVWLERLERCGFEEMAYWHYFSPRALRALEWGHYLGLPSLAVRALTGRWMLSSSAMNLWTTRRLLAPVYEEEQVCEEGVYTFFRCRRRGI